MGMTTGQRVIATSANHIATDGVKQYLAVLAQAGTNPPTATIIKNTLGGVPTYEYGAAGQYNLRLNGAFPVGKTFVKFSNIIQNDVTAIAVIYADTNLLPNAIDIHAVRYS